MITISMNDNIVSIYTFQGYGLRASWPQGEGADFSDLYYFEMISVRNKLRI